MYIYALSDPADGEIRYVGFTSKTVKRRLIEHISEAKEGKLSHRFNWIRSVLSAGRKPVVQILEIVDKDSWAEKERHWIRTLRGEGKKLVNATDGGDGSLNLAEDVRRRISEKVSAGLIGNQRRKGVAHTEEDKRKISDGVKSSEAYKKGINALRGKSRAPMAEETKRKISASKVGKKRKPATDEARRNIAAAQNGRRHSEETKAKMSAWQIGRKMDKDSVLASAEARRGRRYVNNGVVSRMLKHGEEIPEGWVLGKTKRKNHGYCKR